MDLTYRLLNVFTDGDDPFAGNGVAVFENAEGISDELMQSLAAQVNTETVFVRLADDGADADVRFFSPGKETGFVGSASLATASVVRDLKGGSGDITLREKEQGTYTVRAEDDLWVIAGREIKAEPLKATPQILASLVGLKMDAINGEVMTAGTGAVKRGIVLPVRNVEDVRKTRLDARLLHSYAMLLNTEPQVYVWAPSDDREDTIVSRMFYGPRGGVLEVAATGTGGLNLGAWLSAHGERGIRRTVIQGRSSGRRSMLALRVDDEGLVSVGGRVDQVAKGRFDI